MKKLTKFIENLKNSNTTFYDKNKTKIFEELK